MVKNDLLFQMTAPVVFVSAVFTFKVMPDFSSSLSRDLSFI